jgi:hypothetical protein
MVCSELRMGPENKVQLPFSAWHPTHLSFGGRLPKCFRFSKIHAIKKTSPELRMAANIPSRATQH